MMTSAMLAMAGIAEAASVLSVQAMAGGGELQRVGYHQSLIIGESLSERDLLKIALGGHVRLVLMENSFIDLGPQTELGIERLPLHGPGDDQKAIISVTRGVVRVQRPAAAGSEGAIHIYFGGLRASVTEGTLFIESEQQSQRICVESGKVIVIPLADPPMTMPAPLCYATHAGQAAVFKSGDAQLWRNLRASLGPDPVSETGYPSQIADAPAPVAAVAAPTPASPLVSAPVGVSAGTASVASAGTSSNVSAAAASEATKFADGSSVYQLAGRMSNQLSVPEPTPLAREGSNAGAAQATHSPSATANSPGESGNHPASSAAPSSLATAQSPSDVSEAAVAAARPMAGWYITFASVPDVNAAAKEVQKMQAAGYPAVAQPVTVDGKTRYRIQLQGFASNDEAKAKAEEVKARLGYANAWLYRIQ